MTINELRKVRAWRGRLDSQDNHRVLQCPSWQLQESRGVAGSTDTEGLVFIFAPPFVRLQKNLQRNLKWNNSIVFFKEFFKNLEVCWVLGIGRLISLQESSILQGFTQQSCSVLAGFGGSGFEVRPAVETSAPPGVHTRCIHRVSNAHKGLETLGL